MHQHSHSPDHHKPNRLNSCRAAIELFSRLRDSYAIHHIACAVTVRRVVPHHKSRSDRSSRCRRDTNTYRHTHAHHAHKSPIMSLASCTPLAAHTGRGRPIASNLREVKSTRGKNIPQHGWREGLQTDAHGIFEACSSQRQ
jgi:hypothetical protein